jgi:hypothetical protein
MEKNDIVNPLQGFPIEGDFIETKDGHIFEIKDFHQPDDRVVCFLRYCPCGSTSEGSRKRKMRLISNQGSSSYRKIYDINERFQYLEKNAPNYLYNDSHYYFPMQAVNIGDIAFHHRPDAFLSKIYHKTFKDNEKCLCSAIEFCDFLKEEAKIPLSTLGISGSLLLGLDNTSSDLDLIVYGFGSSLKVREVLREKMADTNNNELRRYNLQEFKALYKSRVPNGVISFFDFLKYEDRKLHQGKFKNTDFFIRFLEYPSRDQYALQNKFNSRSILNLGRLKVKGEIRGDEFWWTTPARVLPINIHDYDMSGLIPDAQKLFNQYGIRISDIVQTYSLRGRFIENVRLLEHFKANGTLEVVIENDRRPYLQLVFGTHPDDFFIVQ